MLHNHRLRHRAHTICHHGELVSKALILHANQQIQAACLHADRVILFHPTVLAPPCISAEFFLQGGKFQLLILQYLVFYTILQCVGLHFQYGHFPANWGRMQAIMLEYEYIQTVKELCHSPKFLL